MPKTPEDVLVECADLLQDWHGVSQFGAKEVLAWWRNGEPAFALRGDALRMERYVLAEDVGGLRNYDHDLDISLQRQFGLDPQPQYMGQRVHIRNQMMSDGTATVAEVLEAIQSVVNDTFAAETGEEVYSHVTLMPNEGSPWNYDDDETPYYNAKKRKFFATPRPPWLTTVMAEPDWGEPKVEMVGADFCQLVDIIEASPYHPLTARFDSGYDQPFIVTHSLDFTHRGIAPEMVANFINECGGMLFPSLAVGALPAANFGAVCLVIDPTLILQSMKPYKRKRGNWPVVTYTTDVWTERMSTFLGRAAVRVYEELTGGASGWEYYANMHFWTLGPKVDLDAAPGQINAKIVKSTKQLRTALKKRAKFWHRDMTAEEIEDAANLTTVERYPYLEAKVNGIITVDDMTACVYPVERDAEVTAFLNAIGFTGLQVPLDVPYARSVLDAEVTYAWSWAVHDALVSLQQAHPVELG